MKLRSSIRLILLICLASCVQAQIQGNAPGLFYSQPGNLIAEPDYQLHLHQPVSVGDCVVVSSEFHDVFGRGHSNYPVTDSLGNTYTNLTTVTDGIQNYVYTSYSNITVAGTDLLFSAIPSVAALDQSYAWGATIYKGLSCVSDGTITNTGSSGGSFTVTTSITPTVNRDIFVTSASGGMGDPVTQYAFANSNGANGQAVRQNFVAGGVAGTPVVSTLGGINGAIIMQTIALKPSTILVMDTIMPSGGVGIAYAASLHGSGGAGAYTFACTGLPAWASLNASTGAITGATPTLGTTAFTCTVTDGSLTSAAAPLSITIGLTLDTPALNQSAAGVLGALGGNPGAIFPSSLNCGDVINSGFTGQDSHAALGWIAIASSAFDSLSTSFTRIGPLTGGFQPPVAHYIGAVTGSGLDTFNVNDISGSGLNFIASTIRGAQATVDLGSVAAPTPTNSSPNIYTVACTTLVPNTLCVFDTSTSVGGDTITYSPLAVSTTSSGTYNTVATGSVLVASPSTYTATISVTSGAPASSDPVTTAYQFRPGIVPACSGIVGQHEKFRRQRW